MTGFHALFPQCSRLCGYTNCGRGSGPLSLGGLFLAVRFACGPP